MTSPRNKLYLILGIACIAGYIWLFYNLYTSHTEVKAFGGCPFKHATNIPCPSCGVTRAIMTLLEGNIIESIFLNPFGLIVAALMLVIPVWLTSDLLLRKSSLFEIYHKTEKLLKLPGVAIPLIGLVLANWVWNIMKGL